MSAEQVEWTKPKFVHFSEKLVMPPVALEQGTMLKALDLAEEQLPELLKNPELWKSLDISYHPPRVERLWMQLDDMRLSLHRIHPCRREDALFHPHPWPSAMHLVSGGYEMALGYGAGDIAPPFAATQIIKANGGGVKYEMTDPDAWHYVRPIDEVAMTIMVTGRPWNRGVPKSSEQMKPLTEAAKLELLEFFSCYFAKQR